MGSLYTQHFAPPRSSTASARPSFDVTYEGALASANTTKPLFAALLKGLLSPITSAESLNINLVNAEILARERGIRINESRSRDNVEQEGYSSSVTLRARRNARSPSAPRTSASDTRAREDDFTDQVITGFVSGNTPFISRLGRFRTSFVPTGTLLICRNYDSPGKIGVVGFCWGGGVAHTLATRMPDLAAAVPFYGPAPAPAEAPKVKAALLVHLADNDQRVTDSFAAYEPALKAAGVRYEAHRYPGAGHGFNNDTTPRYNEQAAKLAWDRTVAFFKKELR